MTTDGQGFLHYCTRNAPRILILLTIILFVGSCNASFFVIVKLNENIPYSDENRPSIYHVLMKDDAGRWGLVVLDGAGYYTSSEGTIRNLPIVEWPRDGETDAFIVHPEDIEKIDQLMVTHRQARGETIVHLTEWRVTALSESHGQQEIAISTMWGDNSYFFRYGVDTSEGDLVPLAHGSFIKRHLATAVFIAFFVTCAGWIVAIVAAIVLALKRRRDRIAHGARLIEDA